MAHRLWRVETFKETSSHSSDIILAMAQNLPESEIIDLRDYLYVDRQRVGSLLAQFLDGLPQEKVSANARSVKLGARLQNLFSLERETGQSDSQTLALADLHVSQLEETAEALGVLADVSALVTKRKNWLRGKIRNNLQPGMILRVTSETQISDVSTIIELTRALAERFGGIAQKDFLKILHQLEALYSNSISVSIRTVDENDFAVGFVGEIPGDFEFGPMKRELLLSQVGSSSVRLTTLMQVAAVPTEKDQKESLEELLANLMPQADRLAADGQLDRRILDKFMANLGEVFAQTGFVSAPRWPAISIIPLAIYRNIPSASSIEDDDESGDGE